MRKNPKDNKPELVEQGAGLITVRLEPWARVGWFGGGAVLRFKLWPELLPELLGFEAEFPLSRLTAIIGITSMFTRDLLFDISPACLRTWYIKSTSVFSEKVSCTEKESGDRTENRESSIGMWALSPHYQFNVQK